MMAPKQFGMCAFAANPKPGFFVRRNGTRAPNDKSLWYDKYRGGLARVLRTEAGRTITGAAEVGKKWMAPGEISDDATEFPMDKAIIDRFTNPANPYYSA